MLMRRCRPATRCIPGRHGALVMDTTHDGINGNSGLYGESAWLWPIISPPSDYIRETELFSSLIMRCGKSPIHTLLHLGSGGGHNDHTFTRHFSVTGIDNSDSMLSLAQSLNPGARYLKDDMRSARLGETFDAVVLLDAVNHMTTVDDLRRCFVTAWEHLAPGGVFLTIAEVTRDSFLQNETACSRHHGDGLIVDFIENNFDTDPDDTEYECTLLFIIHRDGRYEFVSDRMRCGLFSTETWRGILTETGFMIQPLKDTDTDVPELEKVTLYLCRKPE